jgi:8-oxo-dGTP pyrophosphatase MutT (NUDIX family)
MQSWKIIKREYPSTYKVLRIQEKIVENPRNGLRMQVQAIQTPNWVMVLPITPTHEVVMVRQYRHGIEDVCLELPGGLVDDGETSPIDSARRELIEETGYDAKMFVPLGWSYPQPAILNNRGFFYLAKDAFKVGNPVPDAGEDIQILFVPMDEIDKKIKNHEIVHGMVLLAFFFYSHFAKTGYPGINKSYEGYQFI